MRTFNITEDKMDFSDYEEGLKDAYEEGYARGWDDGYEAGYMAADSYIQMENEALSNG
jgi:flagellar biosynthesis/type III secretory pathway protein FliH